MGLDYCGSTDEQYPCLRIVVFPFAIYRASGLCYGKHPAARVAKRARTNKQTNKLIVQAMLEHTSSLRYSWWIQALSDHAPSDPPNVIHRQLHSTHALSLRTRAD